MNFQKNVEYFCYSNKCIDLFFLFFTLMTLITACLL